jgi:hypothetical protein
MLRCVLYSSHSQWAAGCISEDMAGVCVWNSKPAIVFLPPYFCVHRALSIKKSTIFLVLYLSPPFISVIHTEVEIPRRKWRPALCVRGRAVG